MFGNYNPREPPDMTGLAINISEYGDECLREYFAAAAIFLAVFLIFSVAVLVAIAWSHYPREQEVRHRGKNCRHI